MSTEKILILGPARNIQAFRLPALPTEAVTVGTSYETVLGGQGENLAVATARLGGRALFCGCVGDDSGGKRLARLLDEAGVDLSCFRVDHEAQTDTHCRLIAPEGERLLSFPGAGVKLTEEDLHRAFQCAPDAVCLSGEVPAEVMARTVELAEARDVPVILTVGGHAIPATIPDSEIFTADEAAVIAMTGVRPAGAENCLRAVIELQKSVHARYYVLRLGEGGAFVYDGTYCHMVASYIVPRVDPRGAEDAFVGAMTLDYLRGGEILPACAYAAAAAALSLSRRGEAVSLPTADEVLAFLEKN